MNSAWAQMVPKNLKTDVMGTSDHVGHNICLGVDRKTHNDKCLSESYMWGPDGYSYVGMIKEVLIKIIQVISRGQRKNLKHQYRYGSGYGMTYIRGRRIHSQSVHLEGI